MDDELDRFKQLDLRLYAASIGYAIDRRESSAGSTVMRRDHDKIIISLKPDGHYTYWSPRDDDDHGTIIDFVQRRKGGLSLGSVRKELRAWMGEPSLALPALPAISKTFKDVETVRRRYAAMPVADRHPYLERERALPVEVLQHPRFAGQIKIDRYGAAVFPHIAADGKICGYELKNRDGFTGFAAGGHKGIFLSNTFADDRRLVVTESGIDALSYAVLFEDFKIARYASIGGKPTPAQRELVRAAIAAMPGDSEIVAGTDADEAGRRLADGIRETFHDCGRADLTFRREEPKGGKDWNEILQRQARVTRRNVSAAEPA